MTGLLDGESALITGGGGGIRRAAALVNAAGGRAISLSGAVTRYADGRRWLTARLGCETVTV